MIRDGSRQMGDKRRRASGEGTDTERLQTPPCALCAYSGHGERRQRHLTHGVVIWLCHAHGSDAFLRRQGGHEFTNRLAGMWEGTGGLTRRRLAALRVHLQQVREAIFAKELPGSYSWPILRKEAEQRFAAGEPPEVVIAELRSNYRDGPAMVPSVRTMRRWFAQARWCSKPTARPRRPNRPKERSPYLDPFLDYLMTGNANKLAPIVRRLYGGP
jgi:hypothetical protein